MCGFPMYSFSINTSSTSLCGSRDVGPSLHETCEPSGCKIFYGPHLPVASKLESCTGHRCITAGPFEIPLKFPNVDCGLGYNSDVGL